MFLPKDYDLLTSEEQQECSRTPLKRCHDILSMVSVHLALNFSAIPFMLMRIEPTMEIWATLYYYGISICFLPYALLLLGGKKLLQSLHRRRAQSHLDGMPLPPIFRANS
jgi:hypothetical protein